MLFLKVPREMAESTRLKLVEAGLFSKDYDVINEGEHVLFPVTGGFGDLELVEREAERRPLQHRSLEEALSPLLSAEELEQLTKSFDTIGDIAIIEIPPALEAKEKGIGEALLKVHRNLRSVFKKLGPMEGEYRIRRLGLIAGEGGTGTVYKEHGVLMRLDVSKVYFSVRLSHERKRIADLVREGEKVLVLFAGVGPFALVIAKGHPEAEIVAVELNPEAVALMEENIRLNRAGNVKAVLGDAREAVLKDYVGFADRVIMPLPKSAHEFLDAAFAAVKDGGIIHFYALADSENPFEDAMGKVEEAAMGSRDVAQILCHSRRIVRPYSPDMVQVVLDLIVRKNQ
jgi:tRNA (guanine37-N1)-methyltransferase